MSPDISTLLSLVVLSFAGCHCQLQPPPVPYLPPPASSGFSPNHSVSKPNIQWSNLLANSIFFYEAQRSGKLPTNNRVQWRNDSVLSDGSDAGLDLSGGYFDAGDYIKCTFPLSFALMSVCWGAMDFGMGYDNANQTSYLDSMLRWGLDWLVNAHPHPRTLFVQVADSQTDTGYWGGDQNIPGPRPSFQINDTSPGTDAAAQAAAAFASCSLLYSQQHLNSSASSPSSPASLGNTTYARTLLTHAFQLYDFSLNASGGKRTYQSSVPAVAETYPSTSFGDELAIAALFLSLADGPSIGINLTSKTLYTQAESFWTEYSQAETNGVLNWDDKTPALPVLFTQVAGIKPALEGNITAWKIEAERYFDTIVQGDVGYLTSGEYIPVFLEWDADGNERIGGLLWVDGVSDDASLNPALNTAMLMFRYAPMASSSEKMTEYKRFAQNQLDYVLGKNPMSMPYVVGANPNSPQNPHSALASGGDDIGAIDTKPLQEAYILYGGVVGGPDPNDQFYDIRSDWPQTEVALDYVAPMLSLAAYNVLTNSDDPYYTTLKPGEYEQRKPSGQPCDAVFRCTSSGHLKSWVEIVMGTVVGGVGLVLLILILYWINLCFLGGK